MQAVLPVHPSVLIVEPVPASRGAHLAALASHDCGAVAVDSVGSARAELGRREYDAVLVTLGALGADPRKSLARLREAAPLLPIFLMTPHDRLPQAISLLREGAEDYVSLPLDGFEVLHRLGRTIDRAGSGGAALYPRDGAAGRPGFQDIETRSPVMRALTESLRRIAPMRSTVLIYGESGVGKELVARSIHLNSPRRTQPFVALNCAAIPASLIESELFGHEKGAFTDAHTRQRGKFEVAHGGTLFLDEIGEMALAAQAKLLRVLEQREFMRIGGDRSIRVDVRVIGATNADLEALVANNAFRRDLYYRLKVITLDVPPLRERREDVVPLVRLFIDQIARANAIPAKAIEPAAMSALIDYGWPGNVRELKNLIESLLVSVPGDRIRIEDLPPTIARSRAPADGSDLKPGTRLEDAERELIRRTLEHTGGNRTHSAELLGIGVRTLQRKIQEYGLDIAPRRRRPRRRLDF